MEEGCASAVFRIRVIWASRTRIQADEIAPKKQIPVVEIFSENLPRSFWRLTMKSRSHGMNITQFNQIFVPSWYFNIFDVKRGRISSRILNRKTL